MHLGGQDWLGLITFQIKIGWKLGAPILLRISLYYLQITSLIQIVLDLFNLKSGVHVVLQSFKDILLLKTGRFICYNIIIGLERNALFLNFKKTCLVSTHWVDPIKYFILILTLLGGLETFLLSCAKERDCSCFLPVTDLID